MKIPTRKIVTRKTVTRKTAPRKTATRKTVTLGKLLSRNLPPYENVHPDYGHPKKTTAEYCNS